jgi:hypothetical protein
MPTSSPFVLKTGLPPSRARFEIREDRLWSPASPPSTTSLPDNIGAVIALSSSRIASAAAPRRHSAARSAYRSDRPWIDPDHRAAGRAIVDDHGARHLK